MEIKSDIDQTDLEKQLSQKFKYKIFYMIDKIIDFHHNILSIELIFLLVQTFQLIGLMEQPWMSNCILTNKIMDIMKVFLFVPFLMNNESSSSYYVLLYFCSSFIIILILSFVSASFLVQHNEQISQKLKIFEKILFSSFSFLVSATTQILYIPFLELFASTMKCQKNINNQYSSQQSQDNDFNVITKEDCFSTLKIPNFIISISCMLLMHFFCRYINIMCFDTRLDSTFKSSKFNGSYELHSQYFVSTLCFINTFLFEDQYKIIKIITTTAWSFRLTKLLNDNMLHNYKLMSFLKYEQALIIFWTSIIGVYDYFFSGSTIVAFFYIVGIVFLTIYNIYYEPITSSICSDNSYNYKFVEDAFKQLRFLCYALSKYDQYSIKIDGYLNRHRNDCNIPSCPSRSNSNRIQKFNRMLVNQTNNEDLIMSIFVIFTVFNDNILKFGGSNKIRLLYALFLLQTVQNKDQAYIQLSFLMLNQPSLEEEFTVYRLKKIIMQLQNQNQGNYQKLDFSSELTTDEYSIKFKKMINQTVKNLLNFWSELLEPKPSAKNLIMNGKQALEQIENIQNQFENLFQNNQINQSTFHAYKVFQLNILENNQNYQFLQGLNTIQNQQSAENIQKEVIIEEQNLYTHGNIVISSSEENFSNITEINLEMLKIIGYVKSQVLSKNMSFLIPNIWQQHHNQFIESYLATGYSKILGLQRDLFIKSKQEYSIPIKLTIKTIPSHIQGLLFQASIVPQNLLYEYSAFIITQINGQIESISPSAIPMFNIDMKKVKQGMFIEKLIPNFWEHILDFQNKRGIELVIKTYKTKMMQESRVLVNVQQITFMNVGQQGYIIRLSELRSEIIDKNKRFKRITCFQSKSYNDSIQDETLNQHNVEENIHENNNNNNKEENSVFSQNMNTLEQSLLPNGFNFNQKCQQIEILFDMRTNSFLGVMVNLQAQNNQADNSQQLKKKQSLKFFSSQQRQSNVMQNKYDTIQNESNMHPFIYTQERNNEERVKDIIYYSKSQKHKPQQVDDEVQTILRSLIVMQSIHSNNNRSKLSSKSQKKLSKEKQGSKNEFPEVYLKANEIVKCQEEFQNHIQQLVNDKDKINQNNKIIDHNHHSKLDKNYGENIKTLRLDKNLIVDPKITNDEQNLIESLQNDLQNQEDENYEDEYKKELDEFVSSKKNIKSFLKDENFNSNNRFFIYKDLFLFLFLVFQIVYIILSKVLYSQQVEDTITRFKMFNTTNLLFANTQHLIEGVFIMFAIDKRVYYNYENLNQETANFLFQQHLKLETTYQFALEEQLTQIYLNQVGVTQEMEDLFINNRNIKLLIHFQNIKTFIYPNNLYQASQQVLAKVTHFKKVPLGQFNYRNNDILVNLENFSNQLLNQIIQYRDLQEQEISGYLDQIQIYSENMLFIGFIYIIAYIGLLIVFYLKTLLYYYEVPSILTTIPFSQIRNQVNKCEQFLGRSIKQDEDDSEEMQEEQNENRDILLNTSDQQNYLNKQNSSNQESQNNIESLNSKIQSNISNKINQNSANEAKFSLRGVTNQKFRKMKYSLLNIQIIIPSLFLLLFFSVYVIVDTYLIQNFTNLLKLFYQELTYSVKLEPDLILLYNCLKSQTIASDYIGVRQIYQPLDYFKQNVNNMYDLIDNFTHIHYSNYRNLPSVYQSQFDQYFSKNPNFCSEIYQKQPQSVNQTECNDFLNGLFNEGINIVMERLLTEMISYSQNISSSQINFPYKQSVNSQMYQIQTISTYLMFVMRELNNLFIDGIQSLSQNLSLVRIAVSVAIGCLLFTFFLFISIPVIQRIDTESTEQKLNILKHTHQKLYTQKLFNQFQKMNENSYEKIQYCTEEKVAHLQWLENHYSSNLFNYYSFACYKLGLIGKQTSIFYYFPQLFLLLGQSSHLHISMFMIKCVFQILIDFTVFIILLQKSNEIFPINDQLIKFNTISKQSLKKQKNVNKQLKVFYKYQ